MNMNTRMDAQDLQQIVELCNEALEVFRQQDRHRDAVEPYPSTVMNNIARALLDRGSLAQDFRKVISVRDHGPLTSAAYQLQIDSWQNGRVFEQFSGRVITVREIIQSNLERLKALNPDIPHVVFYSWHTDRPNNINRGFIGSAIEKAIKSIVKNGEVVPRMDQGSEGVSGSQHLHDTILKKIESCGVFVADVTNILNDGKAQCNSNVMYELGYATHCLGAERIVLICNTAFGAIENLPFDIKHKSIVAYSLREDDEKSLRRTNLAAAIEAKILPLFKT